MAPFAGLLDDFWRPQVAPGQKLHLRPDTPPSRPPCRSLGCRRPLPNRDGIGSLIRIDTDEYRRFYIFEPGGTTNSSNERLFTVGVGQNRKVSVKVLFPSGKQVSKNNIKTNSRIIIQESE